MNNNVVKIIFYLIIFLVPAVLILFFLDTKKNKKNPVANPLFPVDVLNEDTIYHKIEDFEALNANGRIISTTEMDNNVSVVEVFFTECENICPVMNKQMQRVFNFNINNSDFKIFSYTIDPEIDTLEKLSKYAQKHDADLNKWHFLRTSADSIFDFGIKQLKVPITKEDSANKFLHSEKFILVDWNRNIRGYYIGTDSIEVNRLIKDISFLLSIKEKSIKRKNGK